ncbi:MAG: MFS transporter [Firmicutes bacterium]|nr:MFS transporter [Bacillota bacterium]
MEKLSGQSRQGVIVVAAACAIQLVSGVAYLWSLFQTGITLSIFGGQDNQAALTFSIMLAFLTVGGVFGGKLVTKLKSTRIVVLIGGVILSLGFLLASFVTENTSWALWLTYGFMGGTGMGFTYSTTIACAQKWFPHKRGFVTGIIVSALGFGGVIFTPVIMLLVGAFGGQSSAVIRGGEFPTWRILSAVFFVICAVGCIFLKHPPEGYAPIKKSKKESSQISQSTLAIDAAAGDADSSVQNKLQLSNELDINENLSAACEKIDETSQENEISSPLAAKMIEPQKEQKNYTAFEMLKSPKFYLITFSFMLAVMGGQMMFAFARPIEVLSGFENSVMIGGIALSMVVLAISACNSLGRLIFGFVCDKIGRINCIIILLAGSGLLLFFSALVLGNWAIFVVIAFIGIFFGGTLSAYPTLTAETFGPKNMATNYGFVLLGFGAGAILASQIAGIFAYSARYHDDVNRMFPAFIIGAACATLGVALMVVLKLMTKRKKQQKI